MINPSDVLKALRITELKAYHQKMHEDLVRCGWNQDKADDFMLAMLSSKPYSVLDLLAKYSDEFIPEIVFLMHIYDKRI